MFLLNKLFKVLTIFDFGSIILSDLDSPWGFNLGQLASSGRPITFHATPNSSGWGACAKCSFNEAKYWLITTWGKPDFQ